MPFDGALRFDNTAEFSAAPQVLHRCPGNDTSDSQRDSIWVRMVVVLWKSNYKIGQLDDFRFLECFQDQ